MKIGSVVARHLALLVLLSGVFAASQSRAVPAFTVDINAGGSPLSLTQADFSCTTSGTLSACSATGFSAGGMNFNIGLNVDTDPKIFATVDVLNTAVATQQFTATFTLLGVGTSGSPTTALGGIAGGATDNDGNTATIAAVSGSAIISHLIDNAVFIQGGLFPFSFTEPNPFESANFPDANFGPLAAPAIVNSIGLKLDFTLTGQDSASMSGTWELKPIPEPGTALLLGLGLVLIARRERRR